MIVFRSGSPHHGIVRQDNDAVVRRTHANLILGTNHAKTVNSAELGFLDDKFLVAIIEHAAKVGNDDFLPLSHIGRTTDNLLGLAFAMVNCRDMKMITVGMSLASKHLSHEQALQTSTDRLDLFQTTDLKTYRRQRVCNLMGRQIKIYVFLKPFIRNVHSRFFSSAIY